MGRTERARHDVIVEGDITWARREWRSDTEVVSAHHGVLFRNLEVLADSSSAGACVI